MVENHFRERQATSKTIQDHFKTFEDQWATLKTFKTIGESRPQDLIYEPKG